MKRNKVVTIMLCVVIATLGLILGACSHDTDYEQLAPPQNLRVEDGALVWDKVEHASGYAVYIDNDENLTIEPRFDLSELTEENTTYELFVLAIDDGKHYADSDEAKYSYTYTKPEVVPTPGLAYKLLSDGSGYEVSRGKADLKGVITIPDYYYGLPVKKLADEGIWAMTIGLNSAMIKNTWTTGVRLPDTLEEIGDKAFINCVALTEIDIPDSVTKIGIKAFECCEKLKRISLPSRLNELPLGVFLDCKQLVDVTIPSSVKKIGNLAFSYTKISSLSIPDGVTEIDALTFSSCEELTEIKMLDGVAKIGRSAFENCKKLTTINIPDSVTEIGELAFSRCEKLTEIKIPDGVTRLEKGVFQDCLLLKDITFPQNIEFLGTAALDRTKWLTEHPDGPVVVGGYLIGYNGTLSDGSEITISTEVRRIAYGAFSNLIAKDLVITIPDGITLDKGAFRYSSVKTVRLPSDLTCVPNDAFYSCYELEHISLPESVTEIGTDAFFGCRALNEIELPSKLEKIGRDAFSGCKNLTILNIPESVTSFGVTTFTTYITKIVVSAELAATAPKFPIACGVYIRCTPHEAECDYEQLYQEKYNANYNIYLYVENEQDLPDDGGNYWHYDEDGKTPVIWQV